MVFANIEDHRKPFLSAMFAIISLATATFVYLAVDGKSSIHACHKQDGALANYTTTTTTTAAPPQLNLINGAASTTEAPSTTNATNDNNHVPLDVDKYLAAVTGGVIICALLCATAVAVVLAVYCRSANILKIMFVIFCVLTVALLYPMVVFGQALSVGPDCKDVGVRLVPASVGLFVVGLSTTCFFSDTLRKIRSGEETGVMSRLVGN